MTLEPLWRPSLRRVAQCQLTAFRAEANRRHGLKLEDFRALHAWSVAHAADFWDLIWDFCGIVGEKGERRLIHADEVPGGPRFFPDARLNFAENLLCRPGQGDALIFRDESKHSSRTSWEELRALVSRLQQALRAHGVGRGDRVAAMMPNLPETVALMLAVTSLGAIFCSCSPDFGERGVLARFAQIAPKVFVSVDGYRYDRKLIWITHKIAGIAAGLPSVGLVLIVPCLGDAALAAAQVPRAVALADFLKLFAPKPLMFDRLPFNHPVYILFSSGTTGVPKCIVHGAGGTLLQHFKELRLHCDLHPGERFFFFTTCSWMVWN
jgi:acetoacetyl-CoA synthetase